MTPEPSTPQLLKQGMYASAGCALLLLIAIASGVRNHRDAIQTIARDTAPGIIEAQHLSAAIADMDASAANELLLTKADQAAAHQAFDKRRKEAATALVAAAENIKYDEERQPIRAISIGLSSYAEQIQRARDLRVANDPGYIEAYRAAARTIDEALLPAAENLDQAKRAVLDRTYAAQGKWSSGSMVFLVLASLSLASALIVIQLFLTRRMRRVINPLLLIATGIAFLASFYFAESFTNADNALKAAKEDGFESVHTLWKARSSAYSANADESRYLLDPARATQYEQAFQKKIDTASGFLAREQYPTERAIGFFADYKKLDAQIRALEHSGQHAAAVRLCTGESNAVFEKFDQAVDETLQTKQATFDKSTTYGFDSVNHLEVAASIVCAVVALLALGGLLPRLREYSSV